MNKASVTPEAVCLAGPTACGKTAVALAVAARRPVEIISVDSALVYRGMDIGTAKPSAAERASVPHHLIDILDPAQAYSAAQFVQDTQLLVQQIRGRGRVPLLVGGTMMYFHALRQGIHAMPAADATVRAAIDAEARQRGWPALHAELAEIDPPTAARLAPYDSQRIQRALEVWRLSGRALSVWHAEGQAAGAPAAAHWPLVSLEPASRDWLHQRIARRLQAMLDQGFIAEVEALRTRPDLHPGLPSIRCVGYRQAWQALDAADLGNFLPTALAATRQLAKRQITWLRSIPDRTVVPADAENAPADAVSLLENAIDCVASNLL